jgi:hypothetical protein
MIVAMMLYNGEPWFGECLMSVYQHVDRVVIGCSKTKPSILSNNWEIVEFTWEDDYSKARNLLIKFAETKWGAVHDHKNLWLYWIDPDEILIRGEYLRRAIANEGYQAYEIEYMVPGHGLLYDGVVVERPWMLRLFKAGIGIRYEGKVHEEAISTIVRNKYKIGRVANAYVYHHGYAISKDDMYRKNKMYEAKIQKALVVGLPDNERSNLWYHLGKEQLCMGKLGSAKKSFEECLNCMNEDNSFAKDKTIKYINEIKEGKYNAIKSD